MARRRYYAAPPSPPNRFACQRTGAADDWAVNLPYLTANLAGCGGVIKQRPEDFFVQELPLYEPSGHGDHTFFEVQKAGLTTFDAIDRLAEMLGVDKRDIGYAGMKDARALTRQVFSAPRVSEETLMRIQTPQLSVLWAAKHANKLRLGHLAGNRFAIRIRQVNPTDVVRVQNILDVLTRRGMPNYFGEQRFGRRGNNHLLGAAVLRGDAAGVIRLLLGRDSGVEGGGGDDDAQTAGARNAFDRGDLEYAMKLWPRRCGMERRVLARLIRTGRPAAALHAVDERLRRLWVSALQSWVFNDVVARRIASLDKVVAGDLAYRHGHGAVFKVVDVPAEQSRCDAFEISPSGPLPGWRLSLPEGEPLEIEKAGFASAGIGPDDFRAPGRHRVKGARRPLRVRPENVEASGGVDSDGAFILLAFTLPAGSFATSLLREVMKSDAATALLSGGSVPHPLAADDPAEGGVDIAEQEG